MSYPFAAPFRDELAARCAAFPRLAYEGAALKRAAVVLALVDAADGSGEAAFLLTRRAMTLRAHGGQWALPGGRCDPGETLEEAALRELHEELGLAVAPSSVLGVLDDYETRSGYVIAPVVAWVEEGREVDDHVALGFKPPAGEEMERGTVVGHRGRVVLGAPRAA